MSYVEALHLVLFHLTVVNSKKFHDVENSVVPLLRRKLKALQVTDYTYYSVQDDPLKYPVDLDLRCSWQQVATVAARWLTELSGLSQQEVLNNQMGHPASGIISKD